MSTVTDFRTSLMASLTTVMGVTFVGGPVDTAQADADIGCVWLENKRPMPRDGNEEEVYYRVRLIRFWQQSQGDEETGRNVAKLEDDVELLQAAFRTVLTSAGHDFFNVTGIAPDYDRQFVEAQLLAFQRNLSARGG